MRIVRAIEAQRALSNRWRRRGLRVGLVPTMGALHAGHASLVLASLRECDRTVVSVFVNPAQFGPSEDFHKYPRSLGADCRLLRGLESGRVSRSRSGMSEAKGGSRCGMSENSGGSGMSEVVGGIRASALGSRRGSRSGMSEVSGVSRSGMSEVVGGIRRRVDVVFSPGTAAMYPGGVITAVEVGAPLTSGLCSTFRPGHFRGVATVVSKLFHIVSPHVAFFGRKDAQQVAVIRRMVMDLDMGVRVRALPTVREPDGLAMSSRNINLSPAERRSARVLFKALSAGRVAVLRGETRPATVRREMLRTLAREPRVRVQYLAIVDADTMTPVSRIRREILLAVAARIGRTRLIDNVSVRLPRRRGMA